MRLLVFCELWFLVEVDFPRLCSPSGVCLRSLPGLRLYILYFLHGLCGLRRCLLRPCRFLNGLYGLHACLLRGFSCRLPRIPFIRILVVRLKSRLGLRGLIGLDRRIHNCLHLCRLRHLTGLYLVHDRLCSRCGRLIPALLCHRLHCVHDLSDHVQLFAPAACLHGLVRSCVCSGHGKAGNAAREERKPILCQHVSQRQRKRFFLRIALRKILRICAHDLAPVVLCHNVVDSVEPVGGDLFRALGRERPHRFLPHLLSAEHGLDDVAHRVFLRESLDRALNNAVNKRLLIGFAALNSRIHGIRRDLRPHHPVHRLCHRRGRRFSAESRRSDDCGRYGHVDRAVQRGCSCLIQKLSDRPHALHDAASDAARLVRCEIQWAVDVCRHVLVLVSAEPLRQNAAKRFDVSERLERGEQGRSDGRCDRRVLAELPRAL